MLWRLSVPPSASTGVVESIVQALPSTATVEYLLDWAGGLVWLSMDGVSDAAHEIVRAALTHDGGHATLIRASEEVRRTVPVFQPQDSGLAALSIRVKQGFDPRGILNPGRMSADY